MTGLHRVVLGATLALLSGCAVVPGGEVHRPAASTPAAPPVVPAPVVSPTPPVSTQAGGVTARAEGVVAGPAISALGISADNARAALTAFRTSCRSLVKRTDASGLTSPQDWASACAAATVTADKDAQAFFTEYFESAVIGDGRSFATGYYEPEILGSRTRQPGYTVPIYRRPADLVEVDLGDFIDTLKGKRIRGRLDGSRVVPYPDRSAIEGGALEGQGLELAWAADSIEFFFLQVQGSGRLRLPDGTIMRIGYDSQNGRDYVGIGGLLRQRGLLPPGQASMQGVMAYLRSQPDGGNAVMRENRSFVFFRELTGAGPIGALGIAVTPRVTVAADPAFVPLGAPVVLALDRPETRGLWIAQDTGGAIKGSNRFDTFWGAGDEARAIAGGMSSRGQAWLLLPKGTIGRINGGVNGGAKAQR